MAHGKGARARSKEKRMNAKRAMKLARQAQWEAVRGTAKNKKKKVGGTAGQASVRSTVVGKVFGMIYGKPALVERNVHDGSDCGNIGCKRCSPVWQARALALA